MKRLGVLGGTFNPVHLGHLRAAEEVAEALELSRVLLIPSAQPPHKEEQGGDRLAPAEQRLDWVRSACADNPLLEACDLEVKRGGASYTVDTLHALREQTGAQLTFLIGSDAFAEMGSWRTPARVFELAHFAVMARPGTPGKLSDWLPAELRESFRLSGDGATAQHLPSDAQVKALEISALDISSSDIRARARTGRSLRYLVPEAIRQDIASTGVFAADARLKSLHDD